MIANAVKEARLKEEEKGGGEGGKWGGLTDVSCHVLMPRHYGIFPGLPGRKDWNSALLVSLTDQNQNLSSLSTPEVICLQPQLRLRLFNQVPESRTRQQE